MNGEENLAKLLASLKPELLEEEYVFCCVTDKSLKDVAELVPLAVYQEPEGLTLILEKDRAQAMELEFPSVFRCITLTVHSSLEAVGLTAAVSVKLSEHGISANVVAAYYHDHVFVPADRADEALQLLKELH